MQQQEIVAQLQYFYSLERQQADMYTSQGRQQADRYLAEVFRAFADVEQLHAERVATLLRQISGSATVVGGTLGQLTGRATGWTSAMTGLANLLRLDIALERKAMSDYQHFLLRAGDPPHLAVLWTNLVEEDLHAAWMERKLARLPHGRERK